MTEIELLIFLANETHTTMSVAKIQVEQIADVEEVKLALLGIDRLMTFTSFAHLDARGNVIAWISEIRNALVPARMHLAKLTQPQAEQAVKSIDRLLEFVIECDNETKQRAYGDSEKTSH